MIRYLNLKEMNASYTYQLKEAECRVIESGWYILGEAVSSVE